MERINPQPRRAPFADQVYAQLRRLIERGEFPRSARLPTEEELGQRFGVSRPVIRQALARLGEEGIVETRKGSGTIVRLGPSTLQARFPTLDSIADVQQFYEFRIDVEGRTAALAAARHSVAQLTEIEEALLRSERAIETGNLRVAADLNFAFHRAIAKASGNRFHETAIELLPNIIGHVGDEFRIGTSDEEAGRARVIITEHAAILAAIRARDEDLARRLMVEHITSAQNYLYANISVSFRSREDHREPAPTEP